jgi:hypothetical protein
MMGDHIDTRRSYVLDTQALRALDGDFLRAAVAARHDVAVSPLTIWEMLRHLDETEDGPGTFLRRRGQMLKAHGLRILDDPWAAHAVAVAAGSTVNATRLEDRLLVAEILSLLAQCSTLQDFYRCEARYPGGEMGLVAGCPERARQVMIEAQEKYKGQVLKMRDAIESDMGRKGLRAVSDAQFVGIVVAGARQLTDHYRSRGIDYPELLGRVFASTYLHQGYVFGRTRTYMLNVGPRQPLPVDGNDMVDGALCLYLDLTEPITLVTDDRGTREAIGQAVLRLDGAFQELGQSGPALANVIGTRDFVSAAPGGV